MFKLFAVAFTYCLLSIGLPSFGQDILFSEIKKSLDVDKSSGNHNNLFNLFKKYNITGVNGNSYFVPYHTSEKKSISNKSILKVNTLTLKLEEEWQIITLKNNAKPCVGFFPSDALSDESSATLVKISKYFDKDQSVEQNKAKGFKKLKSELESKGYNNVVILDDFGLGVAAKKELFSMFSGFDANVFYLNRPNTNKYFPEDAVYLLEIQMKEETEKEYKNFVFATTGDKKQEKITILSYLPTTNNSASYNHYLASMQIYFYLATRLPGFDLDIVLLHLDDWQEEKAAFEKLTNDFENTSFILSIRNLNSLSSSNALNMEGMNFNDVPNAVYKTPVKFKVNFAEIKSSREETIPDELTQPTLIIGGANSNPNWVTFDESKNKDLVTLLQNILTVELKPTNSH